MIDTVWLLLALVVGLALIGLTAPRGIKALIWECVPGFVHKVMCSLTGYRLVK